MSSIQQVPVEILLDVFRANDPVGTEALQLTCRRFHFIILQNVDTLPTRLACDLRYSDGRVYLYRAIYMPDDETNDWHSQYAIADADADTDAANELQDMYQTFGRKTAIRIVDVWTSEGRQPDASLMHLIEHFPSVKGALRLDIKGIVRALPTDAALHHFERLETVVIDTSFLIRKPSFWNDLFALKAFRRVPNIITFDYFCQDPEVDDGALFDFLTDSSLMPSGKPRVVRLGPVDDDSLGALKRRFYKIIASIGCQVFAIVLGHNKGKRYLTNMTSGRQKKTLAKQLLRAAYRVPAVNRT